MRFQLGFGIGNEAPPIVWIEMLRAHRDFSERDRTIVNALRPYLDRVWRRVLADD
jgi:hypothetical protein